MPQQDASRENSPYLCGSCGARDRPAQDFNEASKRPIQADVIAYSAALVVCKTQRSHGAQQSQNRYCCGLNRYQCCGPISPRQLQYQIPPTYLIVVLVAIQVPAVSPYLKER